MLKEIEMKKDYVSFLIQCDKNLKIINTFWYQPVYLISPLQTSLDSLFDNKDKEAVKTLFTQVVSSPEVLLCSDVFTLTSPKIHVGLCMMKSGDRVFVQGLDATLLLDDTSMGLIKDISHKFLLVLKDSDNEVIMKNASMIRDQFEQIQKLNNNLLNMQRQLTKANSALKRLNEDLNNRLVKDSLTGLVSRYQYREEIDLTIGKGKDKYGIFTFIDIDDFKDVNDTYGHRIGDEYLKEFARRLTSLPFENIICMRISGDEFGLYIHGYDEVSDSDVDKIWNEIESRVIDRPITIEDIEKDIQCSAGMAIYGKDTKDIYDLIEYADFAMYEAKNSGKNSYRRFNMDRYNDKDTSIL